MIKSQQYYQSLILYLKNEIDYENKIILVFKSTKTILPSPIYSRIMDIFQQISILFINIQIIDMPAEPKPQGSHENIIMQWLHLRYLKFVFDLGLSKENAQPTYPAPTFQLFRPIPRHYQGENDRFKLFKNVLLAFRWEISVGVLFAVIYASLNLLLSQIIKEFMEVMQMSQSQRISSFVTQKFVILQLLRMIFSVHMKRVFQQIAIMVQSTISKKLVKKALLLDAQCRKRIPETQIFQLENVDLKLIYSLFSNLYLGIQIPFTIGIAIIWLFAINTYLGVIALYWFLIIFLLQRALDERMRRCNLTKLKLIDQRSKLNYEFMEKINLARIIKNESMLVQKNNDYFLEQNHDHSLFYRYSSLYDIAQLLLPIAVVVTSLVFDQSNKKPMTVEQLYLILSMLGICYRPMKDFRTFSISLSDGFHSLRRLTDYLQLPEQVNQNIRYKRINLQPAEITIAKGTVGKVQGRGIDIELQIRFQIELTYGERLVILGRKGQGSSLFLNMLVGQIPLKQGSVQVQGKIAYLSEENFFLIDTLANNLSFYNQSCSKLQLHTVYEELGLIDELSLSKGLDEIVELNKYNQNQLKLISVARVFCSQADIYILDSPFNGLNAESSIKVQKFLRKKQKQGKIIIMSLKKIEHINEDEDKMIILHLAATKQYGKYKDLIKNQRSYIDHFLKKNSMDIEDVDEKTFRAIAHQFQYKVQKALMYNALFQKESVQKIKRKKLESIVKCLTTFSATLVRQSQQRKQKAQQLKHEENVGAYFLKFLKACHLSESTFILIIIIAVEVLHIFIHFFIGHQYEHRAKEGIKSLRTLMFYEVVLTIGLAGLIYLEGQVSTYLAIITGNKLYKQSLESLVHKQLRWYGEEYSLRTADKFNHDYEEIFIAVHGVLTVYKNAVILISTALFISRNHSIILVATVGVALLYFAILTLLRKAHSKILKHYYDYKYEFVKVFNESIEGAQLIKIYGVGRELVRKGKVKYTNLASYKLASNYITYGQNIMCDLTSIFVTALALQFGTNVKMIKKADIAVIATSILLLLNLADVLKAILDAAIQVQIFFRLNLLPFMEIAPSNKNHPKTLTLLQNEKYDIVFDSVLLKEDNEEVFEIYPLKMQIPEGQIVCICQEDEILRNNLLYGLTKNLLSLADTEHRTRTIFYGGIPICDYNSEALRSMIGVIMHENFFLSGSLKSNLSWRIPHFNEEQAFKIAKEIGMGEDLKKFDKQGLNANIQQIDEDLGTGLGKKIAVLRVLISKPKIVVIKDTPPFIGRWSIVELLKKYNPGCTIIKITNSLDVAYDVNRIILLQKLRIAEEGNPKKLQTDKLSKIGQMLRLCNEQAYIYRNKVSIMPHYKKENQKISKLLHTKKP